MDWRQDKPRAPPRHERHPYNREHDNYYHPSDKRPSPEEPNQENRQTMSTWLQNQLSSHRAQLVGTALVSGAVVASAIYGVQSLRRQIAIDELKESIPNIDEDHHAEKVGLDDCASGKGGLS